MRTSFALAGLLLCSVASAQTFRPITKLTSVAPPPAVTIDTIANVNGRSVCRVDVDTGRDRNGNQTGARGSGVYIGNRWILTAKHVIEDSENYRCTFGTTVIKAAWAQMSSDCDTAIILLESDPPAPAQPMATVGLVVGETTYLAGFDHGDRFRVYDGQLTPAIFSSGTREIRHTIATTNKAISGNSGGPMWNSRGEIIGNLHSSFDEDYATRNGLQFKNCSYGASLDQVSRFFRRVAQRYPQYQGSLPDCGTGSWDTQPPAGQPVQPPPRQPVQPPPVTGPIGPAGPTGPQGPSVTGPQGPQGPGGADGTTDYGKVREIIREELASLDRPTRPIDVFLYYGDEQLDKASVPEGGQLGVDIFDLPKRKK